VTAAAPARPVPPCPGTAAAADTVLFLDMDGVLTCTRVHQAYRDKGLLWTRPDPVGVQFLNRLCVETGCAVVLSSSWRLRETRTREAIEAVLRDGGWTGSMHPDWRTPTEPEHRRGVEVRLWLSAHPEVARWAALDDESGGFERGDPLALTDPHNGISYQAYRHALALLRGEPPPDGLDASMARATWPGVPGRPWGADEDVARLLGVVADLERRLADAERLRAVAAAARLAAAPGAGAAGMAALRESLAGLDGAPQTT